MLSPSKLFKADWCEKRGKKGARRPVVFQDTYTLLVCEDERC